MVSLFNSSSLFSREIMRKSNHQGSEWTEYRYDPLYFGVDFCTVISTDAIFKFHGIKRELLEMRLFGPSNDEKCFLLIGSFYTATPV